MRRGVRAFLRCVLACAVCARLAAAVWSRWFGAATACTRAAAVAAARSRPSPALRDNAGYLCCYDTTATASFLDNLSLLAARKTLARDASPPTPFVQNEPAHRSSPQAVPLDSLANKERAASAPQE